MKYHKNSPIYSLGKRVYILEKVLHDVRKKWLNAPDKEDFKVNFRLQEERIATMRKEMESQNRGLYRESFEHDNCGIGAVVNIKG